MCNFCLEADQLGVSLAPNVREMITQWLAVTLPCWQSLAFAWNISTVALLAWNIRQVNAPKKPSFGIQSLVWGGEIKGWEGGNNNHCEKGKEVQTLQFLEIFFGVPCENMMHCKDGPL